MRMRCLNKNSSVYPYYGGRGISICDEWSDFAVFRQWALDHGYRDDLTIDRLDVDGNYEPSNCIWADAQAQSENRRFVSRAPNGRLWWHIAQDNGITAAAYRSRLTDGWSHHEAATWPMGKRRRDSNLSRATYLVLDGERLPATLASKALGYSGAAVYQRARRNSISLQEALDQMAKKRR